MIFNDANHLISKLNDASDEGVEKKLADDVQTPYKSAKTFKELGLGEDLLEVRFHLQFCIVFENSPVVSISGHLQCNEV